MYAGNQQACLSFCQNNYDPPAAPFYIFDFTIPSGTDNCICYESCDPVYVDNPASVLSPTFGDSSDCPILPFEICTAEPEYQCGGRPDASFTDNPGSQSFELCTSFCQHQSLYLTQVTFLTDVAYFGDPSNKYDVCECRFFDNCPTKEFVANSTSGVVQYKFPEEEPCFCDEVDPDDYVYGLFKVHPTKYVKPGRTFNVGFALDDYVSLPEGVGLRLELPAADVTVVKATLAGAAKGLSKAVRQGEVMVGNNGIVSITWSNLDELFSTTGKSSLKFNMVAKVKAGATPGDVLVAEAYLTGGEICDVKIDSSRRVVVK